MKGVHTKTTNQQNWDNIYRNNFSLHVYWNNILYLKKIIKLPRYTLTLTNFSVFNLWNLKRPISQKKEFWTKLFKRVKKNVPWKTYCSVDYHRKVHQSLCCLGEIVPKKIGIQKSDDHYFNSRKKYIIIK